MDKKKFVYIEKKVENPLFLEMGFERENIPKQLNHEDKIKISYDTYKHIIKFLYWYEDEHATEEEEEEEENPIFLIEREISKKIKQL